MLIEIGLATIANEAVAAVMSLGCTTMPSLSAAESRKVLDPTPMGVHYTQPSDQENLFIG